jgi:4-aminobutyrate aminotransferase
MSKLESGRTSWAATAGSGDTAGWLERDDHVLGATLSRYFPIVAESGEGSWLTDVDGERYLDFTSGIGVHATGHCHPHVVDAVVEQARRLLHTSVVVHHQRNIELAERIGRLTSWFEQPQVFFCNSGAEAVDGALKLARRTTGRPQIIAFRGGFHGRTYGGTSLTTSKAKYREGYEPLVPAIAFAPYGRRPADLDALDELLATQVPASGLAAMIVEPVLGEGGYVVPSIEWLQGLRQRCDRAGALLVFDEVQCGIGRTGKPFAAETFGVFPDVVLFAKGIASGLPLGGIIAERQRFAKWPAATHGSTFGGNPVACAAALATLDVLEDGLLWDRAAALGHDIRAELGASCAGQGKVVEIRGVGLMIGIELGDPETAAAVQQRCFEMGLLLLTCGPRDEVLRLIPPLTVTDSEVSKALGILKAALLDQ